MPPSSGETQMASYYRDAYDWSLRDPEAFWAHAAEEISWVKRWDRVIDADRPPFVKWFPGGVLNTCYNAIDRHIERGRGKQRALIFDSPVTGTVRSFTYLELLDHVADRVGDVVFREPVLRGGRKEVRLLGGVGTEVARHTIRFTTASGNSCPKPELFSWTGS